MGVMPTTWKSRFKFLFLQCKPRVVSSSPSGSISDLDFSDDKTLLADKPTAPSVASRVAFYAAWRPGPKLQRSPNVAAPGTATSTSTRNPLEHQFNAGNPSCSLGLDQKAESPPTKLLPDLLADSKCPSSMFDFHINDDGPKTKAEPGREPHNPEDALLEPNELVYPKSNLEPGIHCLQLSTSWPSTVVSMSRGDRPSAMLKWAIGSKNSGESSSRTSFSDLKKASARFLRRRDSKSSKGRSPSSPHSNNTSTASTSPALPPKKSAVVPSEIESSPPVLPRQLITASCSSSSMSLNSGEGVVREATVRKMTTLRQSQQELRPKQSPKAPNDLNHHDTGFLTKLKSRLDSNRHSRRHSRKKRPPAMVYKSIYSLQDILSNDSDNSSLYMRLEHIPVAVRSRKVLQDISNNALPPGYQQMIADLQQEMSQFTDDDSQDDQTTTLAEVDISQYSYSSKHAGDFEEIDDLQQMLGEIRLQQQVPNAEEVHPSHQRSASQCSWLASFTNLPPVDLHKPLPVKPPSPANSSHNQTPEPVPPSPHLPPDVCEPRSGQEKPAPPTQQEHSSVSHPTTTLPASTSSNKTLVPALMGHRGEFSSLHSGSGESRPLPPLGFHFNASPVKKTCHTSTGQHVHINYDSRPLKTSSSVFHLRPPQPPINANKKTVRSAISDHRLPVVFETDQEDNVSMAAKSSSSVPSPVAESGTNNNNNKSSVFLNVPCSRRGLCALDELDMELPDSEPKPLAVSTVDPDSHASPLPPITNNTNCSSSSCSCSNHEITGSLPSPNKNRKSPDGHDWQPSYVNLEDTEIAPVLLASSRPADEAMDFWKPRTVQNDELSSKRSASNSPVYDSPNRQPPVWPSVHRFQHGDANSLANSSSSDTQDSGVAELALPGRTISPSISASPVLMKSLFHPAIPRGNADEEEEDTDLYEEMRAIICQPQSNTLPRAQKSAATSSHYRDRSLSSNSGRFQAIQPPDNNAYPDWYLEDVTMTPALRQDAFRSINSSFAERDPSAVGKAAVHVLSPSYENVYLASTEPDPPTLSSRFQSAMSHRRFVSCRNSGDFESAPLNPSSGSAFLAVSASKEPGNKPSPRFRGQSEGTERRHPVWPGTTAHSSLHRSSSSARRSSSLQERELRLQRMLDDRIQLPDDTYGDMSDWSMEAMLSDTIRDWDSVSNAGLEDNNANPMSLGLEPLTVNGSDTDPRHPNHQNHQHHALCGCVKIPLQPFLFIDNHTLAQWQAQYNSTATAQPSASATVSQTKETQTQTETDTLTRQHHQIHVRHSSSMDVTHCDYMSDGCETWNSHVAQYLRTPKLSRNHILGQSPHQQVYNSLCFTPPKETRSSKKSLAPSSGRIWKHTRHHVSTPTKSGRRSRARLSYSNLTSGDGPNASRRSRRSLTHRQRKAARRLNSSWKSNCTWRTCYSVGNNSTLPKRTVKRRKAAEVLQGKGQLQLSVYLNSGLLTIHVLAARRLRGASGSSCNTYVKLSLIPDNDERTFCRTNLIKGDNNPWFDQKFSFEFLSADLHKRLLVSVWNRDVNRNRSEFLGCMSFGVSHVIRKDVNGWYRLLNEKVGRKRHFAVKPSSMEPDSPEAFDSLEEAVHGNSPEQEEDQGHRVRDCGEEHGTKASLSPDSVRSSGSSSGRTPYTITMTLDKQSQGYGFSVAWTHPPRIERVEPGMAAENAGMNVGDFIIFVGSQNVVKMKEEQVLQLIQASGQQLTLEVYRKSVIPARNSGPESMPFFPAAAAGDSSPISNSVMTSLLPTATSCEQLQPSLSHASAASLHNSYPTAIVTADVHEVPERKRFIHAIINEEQKFALTLAQIISDSPLSLELATLFEKMEMLSENIVKELMSAEQIGSNLGTVYSQQLNDLVSAYRSYQVLNPVTSPTGPRFDSMEWNLNEPIQHLGKLDRMLQKLCSIEEQMATPALRSVSEAFGGILESQREANKSQAIVPGSSPVEQPDPILSLEKRLLLGIFTNKIRPRLATPGRQWLYHGELWKVKGRQSRRFWALLFTDMLLLTRVSSTKVVFLEEEPIFLDQAQLRDNSDLEHAFDLLWKPRDKGIQSVTFKTPHLTEKQKWTTKIASLLKEISATDPTLAKVVPSDLPQTSAAKKDTGHPVSSQKSDPPLNSLRARLKQRFFSSTDQLHAIPSATPLREHYYDGFNPRASVSYQHYQSGDDFLDSTWDSFDASFPYETPTPSLTLAQGREPESSVDIASVGRFRITNRSTTQIGPLTALSRRKSDSEIPSETSLERESPDDNDEDSGDDGISLEPDFAANEGPLTTKNPVIFQSASSCGEVVITATHLAVADHAAKPHFRKHPQRPYSSKSRCRTPPFPPRHMAPAGAPLIPQAVPLQPSPVPTNQLIPDTQFGLFHPPASSTAAHCPKTKVVQPPPVLYPQLDSTASTPRKVKPKSRRCLSRLLSTKSCPFTRSRLGFSWPSYTTFDWRTLLSRRWKQSSQQQQQQHRQGAETKTPAANASTPTSMTFNGPQKDPPSNPNFSSAIRSASTGSLSCCSDDEHVHQFHSKCTRVLATSEVIRSTVASQTTADLVPNATNIETPPFYTTANVDCPVSAPGATTSRLNLNPQVAGASTRTRVSTKKVPPVFQRLRKFPRTPDFPKFFPMRQHAHGMTIENPRNIGDSSESSPSWASAPSSAGIETPSDIDLAFDFGQRCDVHRRRTAPRHTLGSLTTPETSDASPSPRPASSGTVFRFPFVTTRANRKRATSSKDEIKSLDLACSATDLYARSHAASALPPNSAIAAVVTPSRLTRLLRRTNSASCTREQPIEPPPYALFLRSKPKVSKAKSADIPCPESERNEEEAKWRRGLSEVKSRLGFLRRRSTENLSASVRPQPQEASKWAQSFVDLMASKYGSSLFRAFLQREFSDENVDFWLACEEYKKSRPQKLQTRGQKIYNDFIAVQAPKEVNLDPDTRLATLNHLQNSAIDRHAFDLAQRRVQALMERDAYTRFLQSDLYLELTHPERYQDSSISR